MTNEEAYQMVLAVRRAKLEGEPNPYPENLAAVRYYKQCRRYWGDKAQ